METNICIGGFGGQGVISFGKILSEATCYSTNKNVTFFPSYGAEQRGGTANCYVVISDDPIGAPVTNQIDDLVVMNQASLEKFLPILKKGGRLFVNSSIVKSEIERSDITVVKAPSTELSIELGNAKVLNIIMLGVYVGYTKVIDPEIVWKTIEEKFKSKPQVLQVNKNAFEKGLEIAGISSSK